MHRLLGLSLALDALVARRHRERALSLLRRAIRARFALLPDAHLQEVLGGVLIWEQSHG